jgi:hypothetical protein
VIDGMPDDVSILHNESIKRYFTLLYLIGKRRRIAIAMLSAFVAVSFLSQLITLNPIFAKTMTVNNITGANHDNATGSIVIKNIVNSTNPSVLIAKAISHIPGNTTSIKSGVNQWWQYNAGSRLAP